MSRFIDMFKDCKYVKIGDHIDTQSGGTPNTKISSYYDGGTIPWLSSGEINQGYINGTEKYITEEGLKNSSAKWVPENSVVIAMYGATAGKVGFLNIKTTTNQAVCSLLPNEYFHPKFLYFAVSSQSEWMIAQCRGAAQPNISQSIIRNMEIPFPSKDLQEQFVKVCEQADKSKFGDFKSRFIEMFGKPKAYRQDISSVPLSSVVSITNGYAFNAELFTDNCSLMPLVRIRDIVRGFTETYTGEQCDDKYIIHNGDLLVGMDGDFCVNKWKSGDALLNQRVCKLKGKEGMIDDTYLLFFLTPELKAIQDKTLGTTVKHLSSKTIGDLSLPMPNYAVQEQFSAIVKQADKSKFELREAIKRVESMMKSLMNS